MRAVFVSKCTQPYTYTSNQRIVLNPVKIIYIQLHSISFIPITENIRVESFIESRIYYRIDTEVYITHVPYVGRFRYYFTVSAILLSYRSSENLYFITMENQRNHFYGSFHPFGRNRRRHECNPSK